ncbi:MAG: hypothetical protein H6562_13385 [Lewinellaceae bacterium]|nr:hypothetical protein [Lewinellaceae bacterium]
MKKEFQHSPNDLSNSLARHRMLRPVGLLFALLLTVAVGQAATVTWDGSSNSSWTAAANWSTNSVPTASDEVIVPNGVPNFPVISSSVTVKSVDIAEGATLELGTNGTLNVSGAGSVGIYVRGTLKSNGKIYVNNTGSTAIYIHGSDGNAKAFLYGDTFIGNSGSIGGDGMLVEDQLTIDTDPVFFYDLSPTLNIDNVSGNGISCFFGTVNIRESGSGLFSSNTQIKIGTAGSIGNIGVANIGDFNFTAGTLTIEDSGTDKNGLSNVTGGDFSMGNNAVLTIGSASAQIAYHGILNEALFSSSGSININHTSQNGIYLTAGSFSNSGTINMGNLGSIGNVGIITTNAGTTFENNGLIKIENCGLDGILVDLSSVFTNNNSAEIRIGQAAIGDTRAGIFINANGEFHNEGGLIKIDHCSVSGIQIQTSGTFVNNDQAQVHLGGLSTFPVASIYDGGGGTQFTNGSCAGIIQYGQNKIDASGLTNNGWILDYSSQNNTIGTNNGIIQNLGGGLFNISSNNGTLLTDEGTLWTGCNNSDWMNAENWVGGTVPGSTDHVVIPAVATNPSINLTQFANIRSIRILAGGQLFCGGSLTVNGSTGYGIENEGTLNNFGNISVDNTALSGVYNHGSGVFGNFISASLYVGDNGGNIGDNGIHNYLGGAFTNSGGYVWIDNCANRGIYNQAGQFSNISSAVLSVGKLIGNIGTNGIVSKGVNAVFTNNNSTVNVDNTGQWGISNEAAFSNTGNGRINIGQNTGDIGLRNITSGNINNDGCSIFTVHHNVTNNAVITNEAYFYFDTDQPHSNTGTFTNNGVMAFTQLPVMGAVVNNDLIIVPVDFQCSNSTITDVLQIGGDNSFTVLSEWFNDANLTDKAGDYNQAANSFTLINLSSGILYFTVTDGTCTFNVSTALGAFGAGDPTWTGSFDSDWDNPCNWSPWGVPGVSENVFIPDALNDPVIGSGAAAVVKSVTVEAGAMLDISAGGSLSIDGADGNGLTNNGTINNNGILQIDNTESSAIVNIAGSTFTNNATVNIGQNGGGGNVFVGIDNRAIFLNDSGGQIHIDNTRGFGIGNSAGATFTNAGAVNIGQNGGAANIANDGINNQGAFNNNTGGQIIMDNIDSEAIDNSNGSVFNNAATIHIGQTGGTGNIGYSGILNEADFNNNSNGLILIDNTNFEALWNISSGTFTNAGAFHIGQNGGAGNVSAGIINYAAFVNQNGGQLSVDNAVGSCIFNLSSATFTNADAAISIGAAGTAAGNGIENQGAFFNNGCARIEILSGNVFNNTGNFNNGGLLKLAAQANHIIGNFTNNGVVEDIYGLFTGGTNNGLVIAPASGFCVQQDVLQIGADNSYTVLGEWFNDPELTDKAGDYDQDTNAFIPTNLTDGLHTLYFTATDGTCTFEVSIELELVAGTSAGTATWTGAVSSDWDVACNWSTGSVPTTSIDVIIPDADNDPVIGSTSIAAAKSVTVNADAQLDIIAGGSLVIAGSGASGLINNGTVNNNGAIQIYQTGSHAIENDIAGTFNNSGNIELGQSGGTHSIIRGISNSGTFNHNAGQITIDNANTGIYTITNSVFTNRAVINIGQNGGGNISFVGLYSQAIFNNEDGQINISNTGNDGVRIYTGTFTNAAEINIGQTGGSGSISDDGIQLSEGTFNNNGYLNIDRTGEHAIINYFGTFNNAGTLTIGAIGGVGGAGIRNQATFNNQTCGIIILLDNLNNGGGAFTNNGLFHIDAPSGLGSEFENNGIIQNVQGLTFSGTNNEIIIAPTSIAECTSVSPAFALGETVDFSILGIFTDENATQSAGTFDVASNTFTSNDPLPVATTVLYVEVADPIGGCTRILEWPVTVTDCCPAQVTCFLDSDGDGYGDAATGQVFCQTCGTGYVPDNTDCNDNDADDRTNRIDLVHDGQ